jgi:hypothetical protein
MGLDSFWELPSTAELAKFTPPLSLCGGMFSAHGEGSFRGGAYDSLVEAVTGESLYQGEISPEVVMRMAASLGSTEFEDLPKHLRAVSLDDTVDDSTVTRGEYEDLRRMFSVYAALGARLKGWW